MKKLRVAQWGQIHSLYLPLYVADKCGLFANQGLELELELAGNDDQTFLAVATEKADFGVGDPSFCAMRQNSNVEAIIVATIVNRTGVWGITRNPVIPNIQSQQELVNLRIGSLPKPSTTYALIRNLKEENKRLLKSMKIVEAPIGQQYSLLASGKADIVLDIEPFISIAESNGCRVNYSMAKLHGPYTFTGFYTRRSFAQQNPEIVTGAVDALSKALKLLLEDPSVGFEVSKEMFPGISDKIINKSLWRLKTEKVWKDTAATDLDAWTKSIAIRKGIGDVFVDDVLAQIDNSFISR